MRSQQSIALIAVRIFNDALIEGPEAFQHDPPDTAALARLNRNWSVLDGQTLEWRADLAGMSDYATAAILEALNSTGDGTYVLFKGRDFIKVNKYLLNVGPVHFLYERVSLPNSNAVLALALTPVTPNLIITVRILDKANNNAVLFERSVVDTSNVDPSLTEAEQQAASGMRLKAVNDIQAPPWTSGAGVLLNLFQYNDDGRQPAAEATFDNLELWTYRVPIARCVDANNTSPTAPYTNWATAARVIQDAVDAAAPGDEIVVTNGTYATGGRAVGASLLVNRVAVDKPLALRSVNGPEFTIIQGYQVPGTTNGDGAIRCVYLAEGASLSGFTLTSGATQTNEQENWFRDQSGGAAWCESRDVVVSDCVVVGNSAFHSGGGIYAGTLNNCTLTGNSAWYYGGGAFASTLYNCTITRNTAAVEGGGASTYPLRSCTLQNCTLYFNTSPIGVNYAETMPMILNYCCTTPLPTYGVGNITNAPLFVDGASGNLRLQSNSPCINAGFNVYAPGPTDLDGNPRIVGGTVDIGAYEFQGPGSTISYAWLQHYGLPTDGSADATDPDADGRNTWQEWRCQTDPTKALSVLRLLSASHDGTNVTVSWQSVAGVSYFLECSTNLAATPRFTRLATNLPGQPGSTTYTDTNALGPGPFFYRVGVRD